MQELEVLVESTTTGYSAYAVHYPVYSTGETLEILKANVVEALNFYFEGEGLTIGKELSEIRFIH